MAASGSSTVTQSQDSKSNHVNNLEAFTKLIAEITTNQHGQQGVASTLIVNMIDCANKLIVDITHYDEKESSPLELKIIIDKCFIILEYLDAVPKDRIESEKKEIDGLQSVLNLTISSAANKFHEKFVASAKIFNQRKKSINPSLEWQMLYTQMETLYITYLCTLAKIRDYHLERLRIKLDMHHYSICHKFNVIILELISDKNFLDGSYINNDALDEEALKIASQGINGDLKKMAQENAAFFIQFAISKAEQARKTSPLTLEVMGMPKKEIQKAAEIKEGAKNYIGKDIAEGNYVTAAVKITKQLFGCKIVSNRDLSMLFINHDDEKDMQNVIKNKLLADMPELLKTGKASDILIKLTIYLIFCDSRKYAKKENWQLAVFIFNNLKDLVLIQQTDNRYVINEKSKLTAEQFLILVDRLTNVAINPLAVKPRKEIRKIARFVNEQLLTLATMINSPSLDADSFKLTQLPSQISITANSEMRPVPNSEEKKSIVIADISKDSKNPAQWIKELDTVVKELKASTEQMSQWVSAVYNIANKNYLDNPKDPDSFITKIETIMDVVSSYNEINDENKVSTSYLPNRVMYYEYLVKLMIKKITIYCETQRIEEAYFFSKTAFWTCEAGRATKADSFEKYRNKILGNACELYRKYNHYLADQRLQLFNHGMDSGDFSDCFSIINKIEKLINYQRLSFELSSEDEAFLLANKQMSDTIADYVNQETKRLDNQLKTRLLGAVKIPINDVNAPGYDNVIYKQKLDQVINDLLGNIKLPLPMWRQLQLENIPQLPKKGFPVINLLEKRLDINNAFREFYINARVIVDTARVDKRAKKHEEIARKQAESENSLLLFSKVKVTPADHFSVSLQHLAVATVAELKINFRDVGGLIQRLPMLSADDNSEIKLDVDLMVFNDYYQKAKNVLAEAKQQTQHDQKLEQDRLDAIKLDEFREALLNILPSKVIIPSDNDENTPDYQAKGFKKELDRLVENEVIKLNVVPENQKYFFSQLPVVNEVKSVEVSLASGHPLISFYQQARSICDKAEEYKAQCKQQFLEYKKQMREKISNEKRLQEISELAVLIVNAANLSLNDANIKLDYAINDKVDAFELILVPDNGSPAFIYHGIRILKKDFFENVIKHLLKETQLIIELGSHGRTMIIKEIKKDPLLDKKIARIPLRIAYFLQEQKDKHHQLQQAALELEAISLTSTDAIVNEVLAEEIACLILQLDDESMSSDIDMLLAETTVIDDSCNNDNEFKLAPMSDDFPEDKMNCKAVLSEEVVASILEEINPSGGRVPVSDKEYPSVLTATIKPFSFFKEVKDDNPKISGCQLKSRWHDIV